METCGLPNTGFNLASALIILLFFESCNPFFLIWTQMDLMICVLGIGFEPITSARAALGVTGFMKASLGFLFVFLGAAFFGAFFATFLTAFFAGAFFAAFLAAFFADFAICFEFNS